MLEDGKVLGGYAAGRNNFPGEDEIWSLQSCFGGRSAHARGRTESQCAS